MDVFPGLDVKVDIHTEILIRELPEFKAEPTDKSLHVVKREVLAFSDAI